MKVEVPDLKALSDEIGDLISAHHNVASIRLGSQAKSFAVTYPALFHIYLSLAAQGVRSGLKPRKRAL